MPVLTRIPAVIAGLVEVWTPPLTAAWGTQGAATWRLDDGAVVGELPPRTVTIGIPYPSGDAPYEVSVERQPGMRTHLIEHWQIICLASIASGADDLPGLRSELANVLGILDTALRGAAVKNDAWQAAALTGQVQWLPMRTTKGATCSVVFRAGGSSLL